MGGTKANMQTQKKQGRSLKCHSQTRRRRKMLLSHIEICFQGSVRTFPDFSSFNAWVNSVQGAFKTISIRGVGTKHGHGDPLLSHFVTLDLHLQSPPGRWWCRRIGFLQKQCGHRLGKEGVVRRTEENTSETRASFRPVDEREDRRVTPGRDDVDLQEAPPTAMMSAAAGYKSNLQAQEFRLCPFSKPTTNHLSLLSHQQHPALPAPSSHNGSATQLSSLEREAVRTRGHLWDYPGANWGNLKQYYPIWRAWHRMTKERKGLVVQKMEI